MQIGDYLIYLSIALVALLVLVQLERGDHILTLLQFALILGDPVVFGARDSQELILYGSLASKEEDQDPIDLAVLDGLKDKQNLRSYARLQFVPFDPVHKKTESTLKDSQNRTLK